VKVAKVLITAEEIDAKLAEMGSDITRDYKDKDLLMIGILKGAFVVLADLARHVRLPLETDFMAVSSYHGGTHSSGVVRILKDLDQEIEGRNVLIVEDIIDTGHTLKYLLRTLAVRKPKTLSLASLLIKDGVERPHFDIQYEGFHIPNEFVVGYGLDYNEQFRNLPYVGVMDTGSVSSPTDVEDSFELVDGIGNPAN
jgi:hypoxanthine phosphoribosyltransferase